MNSRLRGRHRWMLASLAALLPIGLTAALRARPAIALQVRVSAEGPSQEGTWIDNRAAFVDAGIRCRLRVGDGQHAATVELTAVHDLALPDMLLYWGAATPDQDALQGDEFLLGSFFGDRTLRFDLPAAAVNDGMAYGRLVLYSLAHDEIVVAANLPAAGGEQWD